MGTLELMAEAAKTGWANPIEGLESSKEQASLILYGGLARMDEESKKPTEKSYDQCKSLIRSLAPGAVGQLIQAYVKVISIPADGEPNEVVEEKKS